MAMRVVDDPPRGGFVDQSIRFVANDADKKGVDGLGDSRHCPCVFVSDELRILVDERENAARLRTEDGRLRIGEPSQLRDVVPRAALGFAEQALADERSATTLQRWREDVEACRFQEFDSTRFGHPYFFFGVEVDAAHRLHVIQELTQSGVEVKTWTAAHLQSHLRYLSHDDLSTSDRLARSVVLLPMNNGLTDIQVEYVVESCNRALASGTTG